MREAQQVNLSKRGAALLASGMAGALAMSACTSDNSGDGGQAAERSGQVVFGESTDFPENLFPNIAAGNAVSTANILNGILPGAFEVLPDFSIVHNKDLLAEEPTLETEGGTQVNTYVISDDAVWSDGTPITADDFEFTWRS